MHKGVAKHGLACGSRNQTSHTSAQLHISLTWRGGRMGKRMGIVSSCSGARGGLPCLTGAGVCAYLPGGAEKDGCLLLVVQADTVP